MSHRLFAKALGISEAQLFDTVFDANYKFFEDNEKSYGARVMLYDACRKHDELMSTNTIYHDFIIDAAKKRGDLFMSDRECAAAYRAFMSCEIPLF